MPRGLGHHGCALPGLPSPSYPRLPCCLPRYGKQLWKSIPSCSQTPVPSCDVTNATLNLYHNHGYLAKVRAVDGNQHSNWSSSGSRFTKHEGAFPAPGLRRGFGVPFSPKL